MQSMLYVSSNLYVLLVPRLANLATHTIVSLLIVKFLAFFIWVVVLLVLFLLSGVKLVVPCNFHLV